MRHEGGANRSSVADLYWILAVRGYMGSSCCGVRIASWLREAEALLV